MPLINGPAEYGPRNPAPVKWTTAPSRVCKPGDVLICVRGNTTGRLNVADREYCIGRGVAAIRGIEGKATTGYLYYHLLLIEKRILEIATAGGSTFPNINKPQLKELSVLLPPLPEQHAIAHVLRTVQGAKEATEKVITATRQLKQSFMRHLFTYGPVPLDQADGVKLKETEVGPVPAHWVVEPLDNVLESRLGKMLSPQARSGKSPKPYLRNANIQWGRVALSDLYQMDFDDGDFDRYGLLPGDVLVCEGGEVGRTAIWRGELQECYYQKALHRLRPRSNRIRAEFFMYHMMHAFLIRKSYGEVGTVTTIAHLPGVKLKVLPLPVPPLAEQDEIVGILAAVDTKLAVEETRRDALDALFQSLLHYLMTGKVRVHDLELPSMKEDVP